MKFNKVFLNGYMTRPPEIKTTPKGFFMITFSISCQEYHKDKNNKRYSYFHCIAFGKLAECILNWVKEGHHFGVEGALKQERWEKEGEKKSRVVVMVNNVDFYEKRKKDKNGQYLPQESKTQEPQTQEPMVQEPMVQEPVAQEYDDWGEEDIPY